MSQSNVDSLLNQVEQQPVQEAKATEVETPKVDHAEAQIESKPQEPEVEAKAEEVTSDANTDEYGNDIPKPRTYTEDEVQRMIRDRLSRGRNQQDQQLNVEQQQASKEKFNYDETSNETWEQQLENFVERTIQKVSQKQTRAQWEAQEKAKQAQFEERFTVGMSKYNDFRDVVSTKPITDAMMMATRNMENPAAFIYAASKQHPQEIERIAKIQDPYAQMTEIGRLEERMKKAKAMTKASKPINPPTGDITAKGNAKRSVDALIREDEQRELRRRRG